MQTTQETLELVKNELKYDNIDCEIISVKEIKKGEKVVHITNTPYYISVKEKKNSKNIYLLYRYEILAFGVVKNHWLMSSINIGDVMNKIKELKNNCL